MAKSDAERQKAFRQRQRAKGMSKLTVDVPSDLVEPLKELIRIVRRNPDMSFREALERSGIVWEPRE